MKMEGGSETERRNKICDKDGEAGGRRGLGDVDRARRAKARAIRPTPVNICIGNPKAIRSGALELRLSGLLSEVKSFAALSASSGFARFAPL